MEEDKDYVEYTDEEMAERDRSMAEMLAAPSAAEMDFQHTERNYGKNVRVTIEVYSVTLDTMKMELGTKTHQQTFNRLISMFTDLPEECLVQKDQSERRSKENNERRREETMGRKKVEESEKRRSRSVSLTDKEMEIIQGGFTNLTMAIKFLSNLMIKLYEETDMPDHIVKQEMDEVIKTGKVRGI